MTHNLRYRDVEAPAVSSSAAAPVQLGQTAAGYVVTFADNSNLDPATIGVGDLRVTGPNGFSQLVTGAIFSYNPSDTSATVTYSFPPPGGSWDVADNGTYTVELLAGEVADLAGNLAAARALTSFTVNLSEQPPAVFTLRAAADAYVRDGSYAAQNFGAAPSCSSAGAAAPA